MSFQQKCQKGQADAIRGVAVVGGSTAVHAFAEWEFIIAIYAKESSIVSLFAEILWCIHIILKLNF